LPFNLDNLKLDAERDANRDQTGNKLGSVRQFDFR